MYNVRLEVVGKAITPGRDSSYFELFDESYL
jgi:hypothetical protein